MASSCRRHTPTVFLPRQGVAPVLAVGPGPRRARVQTKHGARVGVTQGRWEKKARSRGCAEERRGGAGQAPEQMACREPAE